MISRRGRRRFIPSKQIVYVPVSNMVDGFRFPYNSSSSPIHSYSELTWTSSVVSIPNPGSGNFIQLFYIRPPSNSLWQVSVVMIGPTMSFSIPAGSWYYQVGPGPDSSTPNLTFLSGDNVLFRFSDVVGADNVAVTIYLTDDDYTFVGLPPRS